MRPQIMTLMRVIAGILACLPRFQVPGRRLRKAVVPCDATLAKRLFLQSDRFAQISGPKRDRRYSVMTLQCAADIWIRC